jgi:hypothetical protein
MNTGGIKVQLGMRFLAVLATLGGFIAAGSWAVSYFAPAHPDSFAALVGAAATIFAGYLAWESIFFKDRLEQAEKVARAEARKEDLVVVIAQPVHTASTLAACIVRELGQSGDEHGQSQRVKRRALILREVFKPEILIPLADEASAEDRVTLLMVVGQLQAVLAMAELGAANDISDDDLERMRAVLAGLRRYIGLFDPELAAAYARDSHLDLNGTDKG